MLRPVKVWKYNSDDAAYTDLTNYVKTGAAFNFIASANDTFYIGLDRRFIGLKVDLSTNGSYTDIAISNYTGDSWEQVEESYDYNFDDSKYSMWNLPRQWGIHDFTDTSPHAATPPDNSEWYWIRITASAVTTTAVISKIRCIPFAMYSSPYLVANKIGLPTDEYFNENSVPANFFDVENFIAEAEAEIDYNVKQSWKFNIIDWEEHEFNLNGLQLEHKDIIDVYSLQIWDGASYETKTVGRASDFFKVEREGKIYFSRYFLLPARVTLTGPVWPGWGIGEFQFAIRVNYAWGKDWERDPKFRTIQELATKMAALRILDATNYLALVPEGIRGGMDLTAKAERWKREIDEKMADMRPLVVF